MIVVAAAATEFGAKPINVLRFLSIIVLVIIGLIIFLRPFFSSMPFKIGNTIMTAGLLGKVEGLTFLNTRLRTFDGKTIFVPNRKIINDTVINYHLTPTRRVEIDVGICYDQDLQKAKHRFDREGIQFAFPQLELHYQPGRDRITDPGKYHPGRNKF